MKSKPAWDKWRREGRELLLWQRAGDAPSHTLKIAPIPPGPVNDIVHARRSITADSAARLAVFFGTTPDFWLNLQARYDAKVARRDLVPAVARRIKPHRVPAA